MRSVLECLRRITGSISKSSPAPIRRRPFVKLALLIALSFGSYLFFSRVVVTAVEVKGTSMAPTLTAGDRFLLNRFAYLHREPKRGELVVLKDPETGDLIVKRIVGLPCETVVMQNDAAYVNGRRLIEPYASVPFLPERAPLGKAVVIPRGYYFVLGDNRKRSLDSRVFGPVSRESILGVITL
jgi:signal peptidase I